MPYPLALLLSLLVTAAAAQTAVVETFPVRLWGTYIITHSTEYRKNDQTGEFPVFKREDLKEVSPMTIRFRAKDVYFPAQKESLVPDIIAITVGEDRQVMWTKTLDAEKGQSETGLLHVSPGGDVLIFLDNTRHNTRTIWRGREYR